MKKTKIEPRTRPIDIAQKLLTRQSRILGISFLVPPLLLAAVLTALFSVQAKIYPSVLDAAGTVIETGKWYNDIFTVVIVALFILGQFMAFKQFITYFANLRRIKKLLNCIAKDGELESLEDLTALSDSIYKTVPHSDTRSLVLNWLDYRGNSTIKRNDVLENNSYIRLDLNKEKTSYFHVLMNRITLKLGFLGTLLGLMQTFPKMKNAILSLENSGGEMTFIKDIAGAIDGDQYAILTTLIATILSLFAEFLTIQLINRFAVNSEIIMSYLTDWYHTRVEPLYAKADKDNKESLTQMDERFEKAEEILAKNMEMLTSFAEQNAEQLDRLTKFQGTMAKRVEALESYEAQYRSLIQVKESVAIPSDLRPSSEDE